MNCEDCARFRLGPNMSPLVTSRLTVPICGATGVIVFNHMDDGAETCADFTAIAKASIEGEA